MTYRELISRFGSGAGVVWRRLAPSEPPLLIYSLQVHSIAGPEGKICGGDHMPGSMACSTNALLGAWQLGHCSGASGPRTTSPQVGQTQRIAIWRTRSERLTIPTSRSLWI